MFRRITVAALSLGLAISASAATQQRKAHKPQPSPAVQPQPAAVQQQPAPEPPPTPEHGPSSPPEVTFRNGQLTIVARNSTLSDVLNQVRSKTGASIDMPAAPSNDRVVGQFGPGAPRDVMAQLLNGSHFDYVMVGSPTDPSGLKKVVLTAKMTGPLPAPQQPNNPAQAYNPGMQAAPQMDQDQADQPTEDSTDAQPDSAPQSEQQEEPQGEQVPQQQPNPNGGPVVKTPEQLLRELQQQQQQQQNQGQPPPQ